MANMRQADMSNLSLFSLEGSVAMVTGASSGIGYEVSLGLAAAGAKIVAAARREYRLATLIDDIHSQGGNAMAVALDVTRRESIIKAFDKAEDTFAQPVDIIINNAGVGLAKSFLKVEQEDIDYVMNTNFAGVFYVAQEGARRMVEKQCAGSIINIASILGMGGKKAHSIYCASKAAVVNMTRAMALDLQDKNIRVNAIAPGWFETEITQEYFQTEHGQNFLRQTPAGKAGEIQNLIGPIIMLASEAGAFVNGVTLPVDGAHTATWI